MESDDRAFRNAAQGRPGHVDRTAYRARGLVGSGRCSSRVPPRNLPDGGNPEAAGGAMRAKRSEAGMTLIEVLIAVVLFSMLSVGILEALRVGINAMERADDRLMQNRRAAYAERILRAELNGFMP